MRLLVLILMSTVTIAEAWSGNWNNGGKAKTNANHCIDETSRVKPTLGQLEMAFIGCFNRRFSYNGRLQIDPSSSPLKLVINSIDDEYLTKQMQTTGLVSYLLYRKGEIKKDAITPTDRLGGLIDHNTRLLSNSVGKSFTSYLLGHSICRGYIGSLDQTFADWPLLANTLYENERLGDAINMNVGDSKYFASHRVLFKNKWNKKGVNHEPIRYWVEALQGTSAPLFRSFNYSQFLSTAVMNYIAFKTGDGFESLLREVYVEKAKIEQPMEVGYVDRGAFPEDGRLSNLVWASRYDYLRIAIAMLNDWQSNNCVGQYLKEIYQKRVKGLPPSKPMRHMIFRHHHRYGRNYDYGGFFHMNVSDTNDNVFIMHGYGGQVIAINFDTGTIVVANSVHEDWDTARLVVDAVNQ